MEISGRVSAYSVRPDNYLRPHAIDYRLPYAHARYQLFVKNYSMHVFTIRVNPLVP